MTGWGTARLSCAPPRSVGLRVDQIAHSDQALGKDPRARPARVNEARHDALLREVLEVLPGLAETRADNPPRAHPEFAIDRVVERNAGRCDVAAGLSRGELDPEPVALGVLDAVEERRDRLRLDQRHLAAAVARLRRVEPGTEEVAVSLETAPGHRPDGLHGLHRRSGAGGDMERGDASLPHAGILLLFSDLFDQLLVGGALDDLVELGPIVIDEAHASDQDVAGAPTLTTEDHPVVHGDLAAVLGDDLGLHGGEVAIDLVPEKGDLLTVVERSEEHTSELQSRLHLVCRLLLEKKKKHV